MIGEHIRAMKGGRWQHAIDCGDETVLHLAEEAPPPVRVRRSYRPDFLVGAEPVEVVVHRERTFSPEDVVARAYSRAADPALAVMFKDSEAFAEWCMTGRLPATPPNLALSVPGVPAKAPAAARRGAARAKPSSRAKPARGAPAGKRGSKARPKAAAPKGRGGGTARRSAPRRGTAARPGSRKKRR